jgi:tetratricopeptide (TPR) repeat protein
MINRTNIHKSSSSLLAISVLVILNQTVSPVFGDDTKIIATGNQPTEDEVAPPLESSKMHVDQNDKAMVLHGKAEVTQQLGTNLRAWQASQVYKQGVSALSTRNYDLAAQYFQLAGQGFATADNSEKFLAETRYAEAQCRRLLGQRQAAIALYQEAIALFRQYDPLSNYLKAAIDNLHNLTPPLQARLAKSDIRLKALAEVSGIQAVDRNIVLKGRVTDIDKGNLKAEKASSGVSEGHIKKTVLQAFVKMTCLETAELGSTYYTAADRYVPLKANGKNVAVPAASGFNAPIISIKLNGHFYNVGVDLPELSASRRTVYLVTDGKNVLAIDPATYDVWKLYANTTKHSAEFDWRKLTHQKDFQKRINATN